MTGNYKELLGTVYNLAGSSLGSPCTERIARRLQTLPSSHRLLQRCGPTSLVQHARGAAGAMKSLRVRPTLCLSVDLKRIARMVTGSTRQLLRAMARVLFIHRVAPACHILSLRANAGVGLRSAYSARYVSPVAASL